ncbi:hypothetical protein Tco_1002133 [Tanacetum coccineum]|uniref:Uncharacterized protein n=1 Tax=Tanacetum coccineum TaxID=301880 RepID=A0ABQ5F5N9_9ASTR
MSPTKSLFDVGSRRISIFISAVTELVGLIEPHDHLNPIFIPICDGSWRFNYCEVVLLEQKDLLQKNGLLQHPDVPKRINDLKMKENDCPMVHLDQGRLELELQEHEVPDEQQMSAFWTTAFVSLESYSADVIEYFEPTSVVRLVPHVLVAQVPVSLDQDAPSGSHSPSSSDHQSSSVHQGVAADHSFEVNPFAPANHEPFVNVFAPDPSSEAFNI